ncbi:MAG: NAD(P)H-hydrate epimerase [Caldilineales bacterium]|nr:NAD(P)H-hydrate epimerase [Caldilineales bacterium]
MGSVFPDVASAALPALTPVELRRLERRMVRDYGIHPAQILEAVGRNLADLATAWLGGCAAGRSVLVLAGGRRGGGGLAAARHLANRGAEVQVVIAQPVESFTGLSARQLRVLWRMGVSVTEAEPGWDLPGADLVLDALVGYGPRRTPSGAAGALLRLAQAHPAPVLALEIPSGVDGKTGAVGEPHLRAAATLALALPTTGLMRAPAAVVGERYLADIGVPAVLYESLNLAVPPMFAQSAVVRFV